MNDKVTNMNTNSFSLNNEIDINNSINNGIYISALIY